MAPKFRKIKKVLTRHNRALAKECYVEPNCPRSFVIHQGQIKHNVRTLLLDFRTIMMPYTAEKLVAKKKNNLRDFVSMAGPLKVTHLLIFNQTDNGIYLKISRLPQGPTLYFRVIDYCLRKNVLSSQKRPMVEKKHKMFSPCFMTNLQHSEGEKHLQLTSQMFLNMFPTITPTNLNPKKIKRCCLLHYDEQENIFDLRHYAIKLRQTGISKATKKLLSRKVPNLSSFNEMSDFVEKADYLSGSEAEDDPDQQLVVHKLGKKGNIVKQNYAVRLHELGPRLTLKLTKIREGVCNGPFLYPDLNHLTDEQKLKINERQKQRQQKINLKRERRKQQEENVKLKQKKKEEHRQKCLQGMGIETSSLKRKKNDEDNNNDDDDDAKYFKEEVGEEPDDDLFIKPKRKEGRSNPKFKKYKKMD